MSYTISLWAGLAVLGFAMVFSVPRKTLPGIVVLAILAHLVRSVMLQAGDAGLPVASLTAALFVGITASIVAPRTDQATPIYAFAPVIPLIPGTYIFTALQAIIALTAAEVGADVSETVNTALRSSATATLTVIALAVGTTAPGLLIGRQLARLGETLPGRADRDEGTQEEAAL